jgi:hypothetical protein
MMRNPNEFRIKARSYVTLAEESTDVFVKDALIEAADQLEHEARQVERKARELAKMALHTTRVGAALS